MEIEPFIEKLPKVELHIHVEGTLTPELRWQLAHKNGVKLEFNTLEELKETYTPWGIMSSQEGLGAKGLPVFLKQYFGGIEALHTTDDFYELARQYFAKAASMNVRHAEVFFDPQAHTRRGIPVASVMDGLLRAKEEAMRSFDMTISYIMCILRDEDVSSAHQTYEACRPYQHTVFNGIGLDSNEHNRPPTLFDDIFILARKDGLHVTSHCDVAQKDTHEHIRQCASVLCGGRGLDRIDHGLSAEDKPELVELLRQCGIGLTLAPHAYRRRWPADQVFPSIRRLYDAGIKITINSDDPTYMQDFWVVDNMQVVRNHVPFSDAEMIQLVKHAIDICWASDERKHELLSELNAFYKANNSG